MWHNMTGNAKRKKTHGEAPLFLLRQGDMATETYF